MLAQSIKYSDVVTWLVNGVVNYCHNANTTKFNAIPVWMRTANWSTDVKFDQGGVSGSHGYLVSTGRAYFKITLTSGTPITSVTSSTIQTKAEEYIKKVNSTLSANISNDYLQGVYDAVICFCNDNINIATAACPFVDDKTKVSFYTCPVFIADDSIGTTDFQTNIKVEASDMLNTLGDFGEVVRKYAHPKLHTFTYSIGAHH